MAGFEFRSIRKAYDDVQVVHGVDLQVQDGEFVVLVGPSGCGKSTLLRMLAGLEPVTGGQVLIDDQDVTRVSASDRGLAMVFQSYALYPHMTVAENMSFALENIGTPRDQVSARVAEAAKLLQITPYLDRRPRALSGGQRQRVAIGRAIVRDPRIFLFDEPLSNLDAELRVSMRKELAALHAKIGGTMVYVTHDQTEAMTLADKIVVLRDGRVEQTGTPLDLYFRPVNKFVAGFIGSPTINVLPVAMVPGLAAPNNATELGIRPEHIEPMAAGSGQLDMQIMLVEELGGESYLYGTAPGIDELRVKRPGVAQHRRGDTVGLQFSQDQVIWFAGDTALPPPEKG